MIFRQIYETIIYFLGLTINTDAIWIVIPLAISTILMMVYFGIYRDEKSDWNSNLSNSFVLIFVSIALFRYIYSINNAGAFNFIEYWPKMSVILIVLAAGMFLIRFNFEHLLPIKFSRYINSPLTMNLLAYAIILVIYSTKPFSLIALAAILVITLILVAILIIIKIPSKKIAEYMAKEKEKERLANVKEAVFEVKELKGQLEERKKELKNIRSNEVEKESHKIKKLKKILKKEVK